MGRSRTSKTYKFSYILLFMIVLLAILAFLFHRQVNLHMSEICEFKGRETATDVVTNAIDEQLSSGDSEFINVIRDSDNNISSIETNTVAVNKLQNSIKSAINNSLSEVEDKKLSVPLGTLSGITLLSGRGPSLSLKLHQIGAVDTKIKSEFLSAGINQTKHRMSVVVTVEMSAILPLHSTDIKINQEYLVSETIIVGKVPAMYLQQQKS